MSVLKIIEATHQDGYTLALKFDDGDLQWNDYDLCFPIHDLYTGNILKGNDSQDDKIAS